MHWIDWSITIGCLVALTLGAFWTFRYMQGVADFLAANRSGGRYLISVARAMSSYGAISMIATFEVYYAVGFPPIWWQLMSVPVGIIMLLIGWVYYRYRESRCFTLAQFYERRYNKATRIYAGLVAWLAGIVNFGIFPAVAARFFVYFCDLGEYPVSRGGLEIDLIHASVMLGTLAIALLYTCLGGHVTVMVTDCVQGIFASLLFVILGIYFLHTFGWADISAALMTAPAGESMLNPYDTGQVEDFNFWFYLINVFAMFYAYGTWQGSQAYDTSALNSHELKMGQIISVWRYIPEKVFLLIIPICIFTLLNLETYSQQASAVQTTLQGIENEKIAGQMMVPIALAQILPVGLKGLFCATVLFALITTQDTYLHSWGSIFVQDVILPFRKKALSPQQHVLLLRLSIIGVAIFAFFFSLLFDQRQYIFMFMALTGAIISGAGAMLAGGLYWSRGTAAGACVALTVGWVIPVSKLINGQVLSRWFDNVPESDHGPILNAAYWVDGLNAQYVWFWTMVACIGSYVLVSLITSRGPVNLDRILNRGKYAIEGEHVETDEAAKSIWWKISGITQEFNRSDRWLAVVSIGWHFLWFGMFVIATVYDQLISSIPDLFWSRFWHIWVVMNLVISVPVVIWFGIGATRDIRSLFVRLSQMERDVTDMGSE